MADELLLVKGELELLKLDADNKLFVAENDGYSDETRAKYKGQVQALERAVAVVNQRIVARTLAEKETERPSDGAQ